MSGMTREETEALIQEVLEVYPEEAKKDRAKHLAVNDQSEEQSKKCTRTDRMPEQTNCMWCHKLVRLLLLKLKSLFCSRNHQHQGSQP